MNTSYSLEPISIVIAVHDQGTAITNNLPHLFNQHYEPGFEVIVVDESSTDETADALKQLKAEHSNLYTTYIPESSHYLSRRKLALTLGIKAAKNKWVILMNIDCRPKSEKWLECLASYLNDDHDAVCPFTSYSDDAPSYYNYRRIMNWYRQGQRPYRHDGICIAINKQAFMERNGFLKNLRFLRGEYDFIVNESANACRLNHPDTILVQDRPSPKEWRKEQICYIETKKHLERTLFPRVKFIIDQLFLHLITLAAITCGAWSLMQQQLLWCGGALTVLLLLWLIRLFIDIRKAKLLNVKMGWWKLTLFDYRVMWTNLWVWIHYHTSASSSFIRN